MKRDDKLATFRIDTQKWEEFKHWASIHGSNASAVLLNLIDRCLAGELSVSSTAPTNNLDNLYALVNELVSRIEKLEQAQVVPTSVRMEAIAVPGK